MSEAGIKTMITDPSAIPDRIKMVEQDIRALIELGTVLVTVELVRRAQDHEC
jgi:hypothetical protein